MPHQIANIYHIPNAIQSFKMLVTTYKSTQCNITEGLNHQQHHCENLKSCSVKSYSHKSWSTMCSQNAAWHVALWY